MIRVKVFGVAIDPATNGFVVILKDHDEKKWLPIWVGPFEARMISLALEKTKSNRPFSPDLIKSIIESAELTMEKIVISDIKDNTYYATIWLKTTGEKQLFIDARPSDAIAVALRLNSPIFITNEVMKKASIVHPSKEEEVSIRLNQLKNELQTEIDKENYEKAAELRDEIRRLEKINKIPPLKFN